MTKQTLGKLPGEAFGMLDLPALPQDVLDGYRALPDLTGIASDAMDELGIVGAVPAALLAPARSFGAAGRPGADGAQCRRHRAGAGQGQGRRLGARRDRSA